jgi:hypothetical protein
MRVSLPNHVGALGGVATALGSIGVQISLVEIVEKRHEVEIDEFILDLPESPLSESERIGSLVAACDALDGVEVQWIRNYPRGGNLDLDVQLLQRMAANPDRSAETFVTAAPLVFRAQWSVLVEIGTPVVTLSTPGSPTLEAAVLALFSPFDSVHRVALPDGWLPDRGECNAVVAPLGSEHAVIIGRPGDPPFLASEMARLHYLVGSVSDVSGLHEPATDVALSNAHRSVLAAPLYRRPVDPATPK